MRVEKRLLCLTLAAFASLSSASNPEGARAAPKPSPINPDYVPSESEIEAILIAQYRKKKNDILYYKGKKLSEIDKALGIKPSAPPSPKTSYPPSAPSLPLGPCAMAIDPLLVRRDRLDTFQLRGEPVPLSSAKGASVSITRDDQANTTTASVNGRVQAVLYDQDALTPCTNGKVGDPYTPIDFSKPHFGFVVAPFVDAQGAETFPFKKTDTSNLQGGVDFQLSVFGGPIFDHQYLIVTPYYQTDFRGVANVQGFRSAWEPIVPDWHLGGYIGVPSPYVDWFWQFQAAADLKNVTNVGATGLHKGQYDWVGTTVQAHFLLFPGRSATEPGWVSPAPASLVDRLYTNLTLNSFWETSMGLSAIWYEAEFGYNITTDGKSSVSLKYDGGKSKDTLIETKKYLLSLNFKN
jgi:hypothetical protein